MGHHINEKGEFQSDKHPDLPPDRIRVNLANPRSERAMRVLAQDYSGKDPELANDLLDRLDALHGENDLKMILAAMQDLNHLVLSGNTHNALTFASTSGAIRLLKDMILSHKG